MEEIETSEEIIDYTPFQEIFFEKVREGEDYQHFLKIASQIDCSILRSILSSAKIPTYVEGENTNGIYGGGANLLNNLFSIRLYILTKDYDEALLIVTDFIKNKVERLAENGDDKPFMKILEVLAAPYNISSKQDLLGITIMEKKQPQEKKSWWDRFWNG